MRRASTGPRGARNPRGPTDVADRAVARASEGHCRRRTGRCGPQTRGKPVQPSIRAVYGSGVSASSFSPGSITREMRHHPYIGPRPGLGRGAGRDRQAMPIGLLGLRGAENVISLSRERQAWGAPSPPSVACSKLCLASRRPRGEGGRRPSMASLNISRVLSLSAA
jgi:hypothetical protein